MSSKYNCRKKSFQKNALRIILSMLPEQKAGGQDKVSGYTAEFHAQPHLP